MVDFHFPVSLAGNFLSLGGSHGRAHKRGSCNRVCHVSMARSRPRHFRTRCCSRCRQRMECGCQAVATTAAIGRSMHHNATSSECTRRRFTRQGVVSGRVSFEAGRCEKTELSHAAICVNPYLAIFAFLCLYLCCKKSTFWNVRIGTAMFF